MPSEVRILAITSLAFLLMGMVLPVQGKELVPSPPMRITISQFCPSSPCTMTLNMTDAVTSALGGFGAMYNGSLRPAIASLYANDSKSLEGQTLTGFGISLQPYLSGLATKSQYSYLAYVTLGNGRTSTYNLPMDGIVVQRLITLNLTMNLSFGLMGVFVNDPMIRSMYLTTADQFVHRFVQLSALIINTTQTEILGRAFVSLRVDTLDENVVKVSISGDNHFEYTKYFGVAESSTVTVTTAMSGASSKPEDSYLPAAVLFSAAAVLSAILVVQGRRH